jgi:hypothetical protein
MEIKQEIQSPEQKPKAWPKVAIIILNWNGWRDTLECLESLQRLSYPNYQIIVVDNGSTDDSVERIKEKFPKFTLIETGRNLGYTGGNNAGIRYALENEAKYILIVNNDTMLINPEFLKQMVEIMEADYKIGIIGPKVLDTNGRVQDTILFIPTLFNCIRKSIRLKFRIEKSRDYNVPQLVEAISGVCWFIRSDVVKEVGLLDEDYFMYVEEQDYCYRAKKAGWEIMYLPIESVLHKKDPEDENTKARIYRQYIFTRRNLVLFLRKHFGFWQALFLAMLFLTSNIVRVILAKLLNRQKSFYNVQHLAMLFSKIKWVLRK